jgi:hypothetical protein
MNSAKSSEGMNTDRASSSPLTAIHRAVKILPTLAKLNYIYIDSGAMYRSVALYSLQHSLIVNGSRICLT